MRDKLLRDSLLRLLGRLGMHAVKRTRPAELEALIAALHPVDSGSTLIRLGPDGDGGYLVPDDLDGIAHAFSPGVSTESGFEAALAERGLIVHLADGSVDAPAQPHANFRFTKRHVGATTNRETMTLDDWVSACLPDDDTSDLLLQMDIEGAEFEALLGVSPALLKRFRILVIEFHYLHQLWNKPWFRHVVPVFNKLLETHCVVHLHPNNCCGSFTSRGLTIPRVLELTLHRHDRAQRRTPRTGFPHPLDRDNTAKQSLVLPDCWYR